MRGARHPLHPDTRRALGEARKAILLLNRRGWSNFLTCRTCGKVWECPQCDVALVLHRAERAVACHHCGHREQVPQRCDACGSPSVARYGAGTERLEAELAEALDVPVFRLDADTAGAKDAVPALLARFAAAPDGLLIGTQMVAKGHDFPDVTLGVVVDADSTLRFPDFRAEERTFALIAQLAGQGRPRAARRPRARADDGAGCAGDRRGGASRHARVRHGRAGAPSRARLPAVRRPDPDRLLRRAGRCAARRGGRDRGLPCPAPPARRCSGRRRSSGCAGGTARRS